MSYALVFWLGCGVGFLVGAVIIASLAAAREYEERIGGGARDGHGESGAR